MASLFSSSEYIDIVLVYGEALGVLLGSREFPCYFLWGYMTWYIRSQLTTEVLRKRVENAATTIRNNRGMLERVEESFRRGLHYCRVKPA
jgi:hypothetical protein